MHIITTVGPENSTKTVLPFVAAKGALSRGTSARFFAMQARSHLPGQHASRRPHGAKAPGLPTVQTVQAVLDELLSHDALDEFIVCRPCAEARNITADDLADWTTFGGADALARQAELNVTTFTF